MQHRIAIARIFSFAELNLGGSKMAAQFELKTARDRRSYFNLLASNGEIILTSQMYATMAGARKGIRAVQGNAGIGDRYERRQGKGSKSHFVLKAANHRVIGTSQTYSSKPKMEKGIKSARTNGKVKKIVIA
jgi:uncharacterized protein YegP (UPF0339 family)